MDFIVKPTNLFLTQIGDLSPDARMALDRKLALAKLNPYRNKRIRGYSLFLFRIRFEDVRKEKRLIYLVDKPLIIPICILDRDKNYRDLRKHLKNAGY